MTYIAFVGYSEADFKDFKIGNHSVSICRKEDFPDPSDYILRNAQKLGADGEKCIENIITKIIKNPSFKDFELITTHHIPHSGDYLLMSNKRGICFMLECKNKQNITYTEDLQKFITDIDNVKKVYNMKTIGVFLQIGSNKITNHESIELNDNTIYLARDYIHKSCLEIIFTHYCKLISDNIKMNGDLSFMEQCIQDLENIETNNKKQAEVLTKVIARCEHNIRSISRVIENIGVQNDVIEKMITLYNESKNKQDNASIDSVNSLESLGEITATEVRDIFDFGKNDDAKSCIVKNTKQDGNKLFSLMKADNILTSNISKKMLTKKYPEYVAYIANKKVDEIKKAYKDYCKANK